MFDKVLPIADYLKDKKLYLIVRILLNLVFVGSVSSYFYEANYGSYRLLDWDDFNGIYEFFVKGDFFIPLSIFSAIWLATYILSYFIFYIANHLVADKWRNKILNYSSERTPYQTAKFHVLTRKEVEKRIPEKLEKKWYLELYKTLKSEMSPDAYQQLSKAMQDLKSTMTDNFIMLLRGLVATTVYFVVLPDFGWGLFIISAITFCILSLIFTIGFQFGELLPVAVYKISQELEKEIQGDEALDLVS